MKLRLGAETEEYVVFYIDDILIYSKSFEEHLIHLDTVIRKHPGRIYSKLQEMLLLQRRREVSGTSY
jgi:hypothetical protein